MSFVKFVKKVVSTDVNALEHDAKAQYKFNRVCASLWGVSMVAIPCFPTLYGHNISALIIQEVSLWANFATHFGAMSGALAAINTTQTVLDVADDVDDIHDAVTPHEQKELAAATAVSF